MYNQGERSRTDEHSVNLVLKEMGPESDEEKRRNKRYSYLNVRQMYKKGDGVVTHLPRLKGKGMNEVGG